MLLAQRNLTLNIEGDLIHDIFLLLLASLEMIGDLVWIGRVKLRPLLDKCRVDHGAVFVHRSQSLRKHFHCLVKWALDVRYMSGWNHVIVLVETGNAYADRCLYDHVLRRVLRRILHRVLHRVLNGILVIDGILILVDNGFKALFFPTAKVFLNNVVHVIILGRYFVYFVGRRCYAVVQKFLRNFANYLVLWNADTLFRLPPTIWRTRQTTGWPTRGVGTRFHDININCAQNTSRFVFGLVN